MIRHIRTRGKYFGATYKGFLLSLNFNVGVLKMYAKPYDKISISDKKNQIVVVENQICFAT